MHESNIHSSHFSYSSGANPRSTRRRPMPLKIASEPKCDIDDSESVDHPDNGSFQSSPPTNRSSCPGTFNPLGWWPGSPKVQESTSPLLEVPAHCSFFDRIAFASNHPDFTDDCNNSSSDEEVFLPNNAQVVWNQRSECISSHCTHAVQCAISNKDDACRQKHNLSLTEDTESELHDCNRCTVRHVNTAPTVLSVTSCDPPEYFDNFPAVDSHDHHLSTVTSLVTYHPELFSNLITKPATYSCEKEKPADFHQSNVIIESIAACVSSAISERYDTEHTLSFCGKSSLLPFVPALGKSRCIAAPARRIPHCMSCLQYGSFCDTKVQKLNFDPTGRVDRSSCFSESASLVSSLLPTSMHLLVCLLFPVAPIDRLSRLLMRLPPIFKFTPKYRLPWHMTGRKSHQRILQDLVNNSEHKDRFFTSLPQNPTNTSAVNSQVRNSWNVWRTTLSPTSNSLIPWPIPARNAIAAGRNHSGDHTFHAVTTTTTYPSLNSETCVTTKSYSVVSARAAREQPSIHAESSTRSAELHYYSHSDSVSNLKSSLSAPIPATMFPHTSSHHCALNSTWIPYTLSSSTNQADSIVYIPCSRSAPSHSDVTCPGVYVDLTGYDVTVSVERLPPVSEVVTHPRASTRRFNGPSVPTSSQHHSHSEISSGGVRQHTSGFTTEHGDHTASFLPSSPPPPYSECVFPTAPPIQHHYPFTNYWEYPTCRTGYIHPAHINPLVWSHPSCRPLSRSHSCSCYSCISSTRAQMHSRTLSADRFVGLCCCCSVPPSGSSYNCPGPVYQAHTFVLAPKCDSLVVDHPVDLDWVYRAHSPPVNLSASHCGHFSASDIACVQRPSTSAAPPMNALPPSGYVYIPEPIRVMRSRDICNALRTCVVPHYELKNYFNNAPPQRQWRKLGELSKDGFPFTLMCYNLLSPNYATPTMYPYCPTWALNWDYRRRFILDEIRMYHANIICLQEVETNQFEEIFKPELEKLKYDAVFLPKSRRRTMDMKDCKKVDGCAIFWQTDKFEKLHEFHHEFMLSCSNMCENPTPLMLNRVMIRDNVALGVIFQTKGSSASDGIGGRQFCVTTGHIHWDPEHSDVKMIQTILWTSELWAYIDQYLTGSADNTERSSPTDSRNTPLSLRLPTPSPFSPAAHMPVILCGDLNSLPDSGVVEFLMRGSLPKTHTDFLNNGFKYMFEDWRLLEKWAVDGDILRHRFTFDRAYRESQGMRMTNYTYEFKGMIDYVLYSRDHFRLLGSLDQINESWFTERKILGCPHVHFPSDHFALLVELELKPTPQLNTLVAQKVARNRCCIEQLAQDHSRSGSDSSVDSTRLQSATADDSQGFDNSDGNSGAIGTNSDGTGQSRQRKR